MNHKIIAGYTILLGILVMAMWAFILLNGSELPEGKSELSFHLVSEFIMAATCIFSGILMLKKNILGKYLNLFGHGMVIYSVLNAAGYYSEQGEAPMIVLFIVLFILSTTVILSHLFISKT